LGGEGQVQGLSTHLAQSCRSTSLQRRSTWSPFWRMLPSDWTAASADPQLSEVFSVRV